MEAMNKRTILITGATRGNGWAIAQKAAQANHKVILTGRDPLSLKSRAEELKKKFPKTEIQAITLDVSNRSSVANAAKLIKDIDILINNAGITADSTFKKMSPEIWDEVISVNLTGVFNSTHALLDKINQGGQIITLTSKSALFANYAASKAGIIAFTKTLAKELQKSMIRVNSVSPGAVTDMTLPVLKSLKETYGQNIPDEWKMGSSSDVANFIINDLIETEMTGKIFSVNGSEIGYWQEPTFHKL